MRILAALCLAVLIGAIGWRTLTNQTSNPKSRPETAVVPYSLVSKALTQSIEAIGTTQAQHAINVTVTVTDTVAALPLQEGQVVKAGTVLAELEKSEELALLQGAKIELQEQQREYHRIKDLVQKKSIPSSELDSRQSAIDAAQARLAEINARISDRTIRAPFDGVVGLKQLSVGALVKPGDIITTLDDTQHLYIDFEIAEKYLTRVSQGKAISALSAAYPERTFNAQVATLDSRINPITRSLKVRAIIDNKDYSLKPGMLVTLKLLDEERMALLAPEEAVFMRGDRHFVFVITQDNTIEERAITTGLRKQGWIEVTEGLAAGENIVHQGILKVSHGAKVTLQQETWRSE